MDGIGGNRSFRIFISWVGGEKIRLTGSVGKGQIFLLKKYLSKESNGSEKVVLVMKEKSLF